MTNFYFVIKTVSEKTVADLYCWNRPNGQQYNVNELYMATDDFIHLFIRLQNGQTESVIHTASDLLAVKSLKALAPPEMMLVLDGWIGAHGG